jgi:hypothetical protein
MATYIAEDGQEHWVQPPRAELGDRTALTLEQKHQLYRDGYIILKAAVSKEITTAAKAAIKDAAARSKEAAAATARGGSKPARAVNLGASDEMLGLVNDSRVAPILHDLMGYFDPPKSCQVGIIPPKSEADGNFGPVGYRDSDIPYYGANTRECASLCHHMSRLAMRPCRCSDTRRQMCADMDGICTIMSGIPQDPATVAGLTHDEKYRHYVNAGMDPRTGGKEPLNAGKTDLPCDGKPEPGRSCEVVGENGGVPLFSDPGCTLGIGSFTAFVFACLVRVITRCARRRSFGRSAVCRLTRRVLSLAERPDEGGPRPDGAAPGRAPLDRALLQHAARRRRYRRDRGAGLCVRHLYGSVSWWSVITDSSCHLAQGRGSTPRRATASGSTTSPRRSTTSSSTRRASARCSARRTGGCGRARSK